jgi:hypothetical protein
MSTRAKKLKAEPASRQRDAAVDGVEPTPRLPARVTKPGRSEAAKTQTAGNRGVDKSSESSVANEADDYARIAEMLGTTDVDFAKGIYAQLMSASSRADGRCDAVGLFFSLATLKGKKPKDQFQAMLVAQAAVTHVLTMKHATLLGRADDLAILEPAERAYNKLARTFVLQLEAIHRLDTGGEQNVTVQNVSVSEGGQAIVGNVTQGARGTPVEQTPALTDARQAPMPIIDTPARSPVPVRRSRYDDEPSST